MRVPHITYGESTAWGCGVCEYTILATNSDTTEVFCWGRRLTLTSTLGSAFGLVRLEAFCPPARSWARFRCSGAAAAGPNPPLSPHPSHSHPVLFSNRCLITTAAPARASQEDAVLAYLAMPCHAPAPAICSYSGGIRQGDQTVGRLGVSANHAPRPSHCR